MGFWKAFLGVTDTGAALGESDLDRALERSRAARKARAMDDGPESLEPLDDGSGTFLRTLNSNTFGG